MSLVSCITAEMQYTMMNSDCEDKMAQVTDQLKRVTDQGAELGRLISGYSSRLDDIKHAYRQLQAYESNMMFSNNPNAQQGIAAARQREAYLVQQDCALRAQMQQLETEQRMLANQEKELTAQKTYWDTMYKFSQGAMQKFSQMKDGAINRFFGGR